MLPDSDTSQQRHLDPVGRSAESEEPTCDTKDSGKRGPSRPPELTFKLWDLSCWAFWQSFMTGVASQGYSDSTAPKQEAYLLAACVLRGRQRGKR